MKRSKRDLFAVSSDYTGLTGLLGLLPTKDLLLVLNYHRIGNPDDSQYDPGVFSVTSEELDEHVRFVKRRFHIATLAEAIEIVEGRRRSRGTAVLLTFDDGYLDNYQSAFPILSSRSVQGVFFLPTSFVGTNRLPWWDVMAWIVRRARKPIFELKYPGVHRFDVGRDGICRVIEQVLWVYKRAAQDDATHFVDMLEEACGASRPDGSERCFLNWDEARIMLRGGMAFGAHSHSHEILAPLSSEQQLDELTTSKRMIEERLGVPVHSMSYPIGLPGSFSMVTREAAEKAQYRVAFSFYGGFNPYGKTERYDVRRFAVSAPPPRFRLQTTLAAATGKYWF